MNTPKVCLRAMEPEDLDFLYDMENNRAIWNIGNTSVPYSRYVLHDYIANASNDIYYDGQVRMIIDNNKGISIGIADVFNFDAQHRRAEVSIVIKDEYRRQGYATEAIAQMAHYALHTLKLHQLYAIVAESNKASIALFANNGYAQSATLKEWLFNGEEYENAIVFHNILSKK